MDDILLTFHPVDITYGYSSDGNYLTSQMAPLGNQTKYAYDSERNVTSVTDPKGNSLSMTYDKDNELLTQTSTADNLKVHYQYDNNGNPTQVTETSADGTTTYATNSHTYNSLNQVTSSTNPLHNVTSYAYDANGNLNQVTLPDTHKLGVTCDNAGEPTTVSVDGTAVNQYSYDKNGDITSIQGGGVSCSYSYDKNGNLLSQTDSVCSQSYGYKPDNALSSITTTVGNTTIQTGYNLNKQDQVINVSKDGATQATYVYNSHGQYDWVKLGNGIT